MKIKTLLPLLFVLGMSLVFFVRQSQAQTNEDYTWQYYVPQAVSGADDLRTILVQEVRDIIAAGHLAPFGALYGEGPRQFYWYQRFDVVYTLSMAYPYLPAEVQAQVKTYLKSEMQNFPLWNGDLLSANVGTRREPDQITDAERGSIPAVYSNRPKLFSMYALWLYAQQTGDWTYIEQNWSSIVSFYNANRGEASRFYQSIAGAIGMARMARQKPTPDTQMQNTASTDVTNGLSAGTNYTQFGQNATTAYIWNDNGIPWTTKYIYEGFQLLNTTPEIGRYISANANLKTALFGSSRSDMYSLKRAEYYFPLWYMAQGSAFSRYFGEGSSQSPDIKAMLFPIKAWVQKLPSSTLRLYVDTPDALVGDFYYLQGLVYTIQAHGRECWEDIRTASVECAGSALPTVPPLTLTSSPIPSLTSVPATFTTTPSATVTATLTPTATIRATNTLIPATATFTPTVTLTKTSTNPPPTATVAPTNTLVPPTATLVPPTATLVPPTSTPIRVTLPPPTATQPPVSGNARIEVKMSLAAAGTVEVNVNLANVTNLYGIQLDCTVDPSVLAGTSYTGSDGFNDTNSFFVNKGFDAQTGRWSIGVTRVRPSAPITGSMLAFKLSYSILQVGANPAFNCSVQAVDVNGADVLVDVVITSLDGQLIATMVPTGQPQPTLIPTATVVPPTITPGGFSLIQGVAQYPGRIDHAGITVSLYSLDTFLAEATTLSDGAYQFKDLPIGVYLVRINAPHSLQIEHQILVKANSQLIDLGIDLLPMGDIDSNGSIDLADASFIGANYGVDAVLAPAGDLTQDKVIDINDMVLVGNSFGLVAPIIEATP